MFQNAFSRLRFCRYSRVLRVGLCWLLSPTQSSEPISPSRSESFVAASSLGCFLRLPSSTKLHEIQALCRRDVRGPDHLGIYAFFGRRRGDNSSHAWNDPRQSALHFLDAVMIVECKATDSPSGVELGLFVRKLQARGSHNGALVALSGITGTADQSSSTHREAISRRIG